MFSPNMLVFKPLKGKETKTVLHGFVEMVNKFKRKPSKLLVDQEKNFIIALCNNS